MSRTFIDSSNPGPVAPAVYLFIKQRGNEGALNIPASGGIFTFHAATGTKQFYILVEKVGHEVFVPKTPLKPCQLCPHGEQSR